MNCDLFAHQLSAFLDGELRDDAAAKMRGHRRTCAHCAGMAADHVAMLGGLRGLAQVEPPAPLWRGITDALSRQDVALAAAPAPRRLAPWRGLAAALTPRRRRVGAVAALTALSVLGIALFWNQQRGDAAGPQQGASFAARALRAATPADFASTVGHAPRGLEVIARDPSDPGTPSADDFRDVSDAIEDEDARILSQYQAAANELLGLIEAEQQAWEHGRVARFDRSRVAHEQRLAVATGRQREIEWQRWLAVLNDVVHAKAATL